MNENLPPLIDSEPTQPEAPKTDRQSGDKYDFMPGARLLSEIGDSEERIGPNKRVKNDFVVEAEALLKKHAPLAVTFDIRPIHPPFFREFSYTDTMYGILVTTLSGEINQRLRDLAAETPAKKDFPINKAGDKYEVRRHKQKGKYKKVIFLPGWNTVSLLNESLLMELALDEEWVVKPHPIADPRLLADCIVMFGSDRVLNSEVSGHDLLEGADEVACSAASELYLMAVLKEIPVTNITSFAKQHGLAYGSFVTTHERYRKAGASLSELRQYMNNMLMSDYSGFIMAGNGTRRNTQILKSYFNKALELREPFRMTTPQRLHVDNLSMGHWFVEPMPPKPKP